MQGQLLKRTDNIVMLVMHWLLANYMSIWYTCSGMFWLASLIAAVCGRDISDNLHFTARRELPCLKILACYRSHIMSLVEGIANSTLKGRKSEAHQFFQVGQST